MTMVVMAYLPTLKLCLQAFDCTDLVNGRRRLVADSGIDCDSDRHGLVTAGCGLLLVFMVFTPLASVAWTCVHRSRGQHVGPRDGTTVTTPMFEAYRDSFPYVEFWLLFLKVAPTSVALFVPYDFWNAAGVAGLLLLHCLFALFGAPWRVVTLQGSLISIPNALNHFGRTSSVALLGLAAVSAVHEYRQSAATEYAQWVSAAVVGATGAVYALAWLQALPIRHGRDASSKLEKRRASIREWRRAITTLLNAHKYDEAATMRGRLVSALLAYGCLLPICVLTPRAAPGFARQCTTSWRTCGCGSGRCDRWLPTVTGAPQLSSMRRPACEPIYPCCLGTASQTLKHSSNPSICFLWSSAMS